MKEHILQSGHGNLNRADTGALKQGCWLYKTSLCPAKTLSGVIEWGALHNHNILLNTGSDPKQIKGPLQ